MLDLMSKRVTVMGLGRFGGGVGVCRWLARQGAEVLVTDLEPASELVASVEAIRPLVDSGQVRLRLGEHNVGDFTNTDLVVANPAVPKPWDNRFLRAAADGGVRVTTEIQLVFERIPDRRRVITVTGSVGKSTTTAMISHAMRSTGHRVHMGGNIGGTLLDSVESARPGDWFVLELSSFMLYWLEDMFKRSRLAPHIAVLTNISANHIDWHASMAHYEACKRYIYQFQEAGDAVIFGPSLVGLASQCEQRVRVADRSGYKWRLSVPGLHNVENAATAIAACSLASPEIPADVFAKAITGFGGLPHRLQLVAEVEKRGSTEHSAAIRYYNDSKSTTPESAMRAVEAISEMPGMSLGRVHLIVGGYDKQSDLSKISQLGTRVGGLYTIGATGPAIAGKAGANALVHQCGTLAEAVRCASTRLRPGDVLLLSPACASWDQYKNYEERGNEYIRLVGTLVDASGGSHQAEKGSTGEPS